MRRLFNVVILNQCGSFVLGQDNRLDVPVVRENIKDHLCRYCGEAEALDVDDFTRRGFLNYDIGVSLLRRGLSFSGGLFLLDWGVLPEVAGITW